MTRGEKRHGINKCSVVKDPPMRMANVLSLAPTTYCGDSNEAMM